MAARFVRILIVLVLISVPVAIPAQNRTYLVGVEKLDYLPYYSDRSGKYMGFAREILDAFAKKQGYTFTYSILPVKRLYKYLIEKKVDLKFPDNTSWSPDLKKGIPITYSDPVVDYIDGVMVLPKHKGRGIDGLKKLGTVRGFHPWDYLKLIKSNKMRLLENNSFSGLLKQTVAERIDGAYINPMVGLYHLEHEMKRPDDLVFDPDLPHSRGSYLLSSANHPELIQAFNRFLKKEKRWIDGLKRKYNLLDTGL